MRTLFLLILFSLYTLIGIGQNLTLTFSGKDVYTSAIVPLEVVYVQNTTRGCDTILSGSAPSLVISVSSGIGNQTSQIPESFSVLPAVPNPFSGKTNVQVIMNHGGTLGLSVFDTRGKAIAEYKNTFPTGKHNFEVRSSTSSLLLLKISDGQITKTIKLLNSNNGSIENRITFTGTEPAGIKSTFTDPFFSFHLGDELLFKSYKSNYYDKVITDSPGSNSSYVFELTPLTAIPAVITLPVSNVGITTATGSGDVTSDRGSGVTAKGICWSLLPNPSRSSSHTTNGADTGLFISNIEGLIPDTVYYLRAYAINSLGTAYGELATFSTINYPQITTDSITAITDNSAISGGNVISDGGAPVTARGVCWSTLHNPTTTDSITIDSSGTGTFTSNITGLTLGTVYYVRAYASNKGGSGYGLERSFKTIDLPTVTTVLVYHITRTTASCDGNLIAYGGDTSTFRGVCWSNLPHPTNTGAHTVNGSGLGSYTGEVTGLTENTKYYIRAYATNSAGTRYGNELDFTTPTYAAVETAVVTNINQNSATGGGQVTFDGGIPVTARGVCWSTSQSPTTADNHTADGAGTGPFTSNMTSLTWGTLYHIRAYAINNVGTSYGNERTFTTLSTPSVTTAAVTNITLTTATSGGNVTSEGGAPVTARGVCWSTSPNPTTADSLTANGTGIGMFLSSITGLTGGTLYHLRAYAINSFGTEYGGELTFTTTNLPTLTTSAVTNITQTTAVSGGNITSTGGSPVIARGVCWSTLTDPAITDSLTADGSGAGSFVSNITGLTTGVEYYVRAYATSSIGTAYGNQHVFTTLSVPTLVTTVPSGITRTSAISGGDITSDGGSPVTVRGVCWSITPVPTTAGSHTTDGSDTGTFVSNITGLTSGLTYYLRAYGTNSTGTAYGNELSFTTPDVPTVTTSPVTIVTQTTATLGGNVQSDGGSTVTARGVCWSTAPGPTIANNHTLDGTGIGQYVSNITGLTGGTLYYVRAYATNSTGTSYGLVITFTTFNLATLTTTTVTGITQTTATSGGTIASDGGVDVSARGVCWSTSPNPTTSNNFTSDGRGTGSFVSNITGLVANTIYYLRAYATNAIGSAYGNEINFSTLWPSCPGIPTVVYEGKSYNTVQIGIQCWFRDNLNVGNRINGPVEQINNGIKEKYCFNDLESNCTIYGGLYQWGEVMQYVSTVGAQGLCPAGWHLPSDAEYNLLTAFLGGAGVAGGPLKEAGTTHWASPNTGATNASGFSGLPGGVRNFSTGTFSFLSTSGTFWTSSSYVAGGYDFMKMFRAWNYDATFQEVSTNLGYGVSVKCLKN